MIVFFKDISGFSDKELERQADIAERFSSDLDKDVAEAARKLAADVAAEQEHRQAKATRPSCN